MTTRRALALAALIPASALVVTVATVPASARTADDRCVSSAPIPVRAAVALARSGCALAGRVVTDGRVSVVVPPAGMSVAGDGVGRAGDVRGLRVTNTGSGLRVASEGRGGGGGWFIAPLNPTSGGTISTSAPIGTTTMMTALPTSSTTTGRATPQRAGDPPACKDRTFNLEHHKWNKALRYHVNLAKMPKRFGKKTVVDQIKHANANMRKGRNTCGKPRLKTPASHYLGRTAKKPNITASGPTCGAGNELNVVGFADLPGDLLGWTCYWYIGKRMVGTDMLLDNGPGMATKLPSPCVNKWDFEGTVTHEWGHAYGLAHTGDGHSNLTMQHLLSPCSKYARTLGIGDWLGMKKMYGAR